MKYRRLMMILMTSSILATTPVMARQLNEKVPTEETMQIENPLINADSDMQSVIDTLVNMNPKAIENLTAPEARMQPSAQDAARVIMRNQGLDPNDDMGVSTRDISVQGEAGAIPARVYIPQNVNSRQPLPLIVYYHGGGWVIGTNDTYDSTPRIIAKKVNAIVVSVEYRKAPEFKFPAAYNDAFAAYTWVLHNAAALGGDANRVAVMGESAGGSLALSVSMMARENHVQMPVYQVLIYPVAGTSMYNKSYVEERNAKPLSKAMMQWFFKNTIRDSDDKKDPRLDPLDYADLSGLPATTLITAQIDPLRTEGRQLADELKSAGVKVDYKNYKGVTHEFFGMGAVVKKAEEAEDRVASDLITAFMR